jgi:hypothetical protein
MSAKGGYIFIKKKSGDVLPYFKLIMTAESERKTVW